jgi:hypothetical protein
MKNKKYHTVGTIPKSDIKIVERSKMDTPNTQMVDGLLSWLDTGTSMKSFMSSNLPSKRNISS